MTGIRMAFGQFKYLEEDDILFAKQLGASGITVNRPDFDDPTWIKFLGNYYRYNQIEGSSNRWELFDLVNLKGMIEQRGLRLEALENTPLRFYNKALLGLPGRDEQIENYQETIRNVGRAGIRILGYHWMTSLVWRTARFQLDRGGALVTAFDADSVADGPPTHGEVIDADRVWANYSYFIKAVLPVAEEAGVTLALHPDDPPVPMLGGVARVIHGIDGYTRALEIGNSPNHKINFCVGTFAEKSLDEMYEAVRHFGSMGKIAYVHLRNVRGMLPKFSEAFIDDGDIDVERVLATLVDVGFDSFILDDHVPKIAGDTQWGHRAHAHATGYIAGLLHAVKKNAERKG